MTSWCATFSPTETNGASGYFAMVLNDDGTALYYYSFSVLYMVVNKAMPTCDYSTGLQYFISPVWNLTAKSSSWGPTCSRRRYDPTFACSPSPPMVPLPWQCRALGRPTASNNSRCTPSLYAAGNYDVCEVGFLSAKFGRAVSSVFSGTNVLTYTYNSPPGALVDFTPPFPAAFSGNVSTSPSRWSSITFTCNGVPLFCGKLTYYSSGSACGFPGPPQAPEPVGLDGTGIALAVVSALFVAYVVTTVALFVNGFAAPPTTPPTGTKT